ncbi:MAG: serine protease [Lachnospiraceae bacterium]|nr:serine protease [Lachnospiraceae bacterium]
MEENKDGLHKEEYQVIQETIIPKKKSVWKRRGKALLRIVISAVIFGVVAGAVFVISGKFLLEKFGLESTFRQVVGIGSPEQNPVPTKPPVPTGEPAPDTTKTPDSSDTTPEEKTEVEVTIGSNKEETPPVEFNPDDTIQGYLNTYSGIAELAEGLKKSLVQITAITEGVDWFEESYETTKTATGLYVGDNGVDMLFLVNLDRIEGATKFNVTFANGTTRSCSIFAYDTNYRLAVLSVRLSLVPYTEKPEKAQFALQEVKMGTPVMALGNPNGHVGAMELGMITGVSQVVQVIDDEVLYFTTGITEYAEGDGFVYNLSGEVIGIMSNSLNKGEEGIITAAMVNGMQEIMEDILNNVPRVYCGLCLETVAGTMGGKYKLPEGIYVTEVLPGSPAMNAGIKIGDIITTVGIKPVTGVRQFHEEISKADAQSVRIIVSRETKGERKEHSLYMQPEMRLH